MNIIKIRFEYGCFPVWIYGEHHELIENDLPTYLIGDTDVESIFIHIQEIYNSLYLDDGKEFKYIGFQNEEERKNFLDECSKAVNLLKDKLNDEYIMSKNSELSGGFMDI